jgi:uncharacterized SAM-binding protein YcdF (DUF218 family)
MFSELKPYLTVLALPPASLLFIIVIGALFIDSKPKLAKRAILLAVTALWLISTSFFSVLLHNQVIADFPLVTANDLNERSVQAIVVLGGGIVTDLPSGDRQMSKTSLERLRLGAQLARQTGLPLVFSGGAGWGSGNARVAEADVADKVLHEAFGTTLKFKESYSRDTQENAANTWDLLYRQEIHRIALVTHSYHMPRASAEFRSVGFDVIEAAMGQPTDSTSAILSLMPNVTSSEVSHNVFRELLAQLIQKFRGI